MDRSRNVSANICSKFLVCRVEKFEEQLRQAEEVTDKTKSSEHAAWAKNAEALERIHSLARERDQVRETLENQYALAKREEARYQVTLHQSSWSVDVGVLTLCRLFKNVVKLRPSS
jgi:hypothetical protein